MTPLVPQFNPSLPPCTFEDGMLAVARFRLNKGCIARRFDNDVQDLCMQHIVTATPIDGMELIEEYIPGILARMK
jgi:hypothetical protein